MELHVPNTTRQICKNAYSNRVGGNSCECVPGMRFVGTRIGIQVHARAFTRDGQACTVGKLLHRQLLFSIAPTLCLFLFTFSSQKTYHAIAVWRGTKRWSWKIVPSGNVSSSKIQRNWTGSCFVSLSVNVGTGKFYVIGPYQRGFTAYNFLQQFQNQEFSQSTVWPVQLHANNRILPAHVEVHSLHIPASCEIAKLSNFANISTQKHN